MMTTTQPATVTIDFDQDAHGNVAMQWRAPIIGQRRTSFASPYDAATLPVIIKALDALQTGRFTFTEDERAILAHAGLWQQQRVAANAYTLVGRMLYDALGSDGQSALAMVRNTSIAYRTPLSYVLRFPAAAVALAALPWELLADMHEPILMSNGNLLDSCERYITLERALPPTPLAAGEVPHLLALSPHYGIPADVRAEEQRARYAIWEPLRDQGLLTFDEISPLTRRALSDYLRRAARRPDIVHYYGHGTYGANGGALLFDTDAGGSTLVRADQLRTLLGDVRLIVLFACKSAMVATEGELLTGIAPALSIVAGAIVAMQLSVRVAAATRFSEVFYEELLMRRRSLQEAVAQARQALFVEEEETVSWYVPTLHIRGREAGPVYLVPGTLKQPDTLPHAPAAPHEERAPAPLPAPIIVMLDVFRVTLTPGISPATLTIENTSADELVGVGVTCAGLGGLTVSFQPTKIARLRAHSSTTFTLRLSGPLRAQMRLNLSYPRAGNTIVRAETLLDIELPTPPAPAQKPTPTLPKHDRATEFKQRRLQALEQQAALYGPRTDPATLIEIEDLRRELGIDN